MSRPNSSTTAMKAGAAGFHSDARQNIRVDYGRSVRRKHFSYGAFSARDVSS